MIDRLETPSHCAAAAFYATILVATVTVAPLHAQTTATVPTQEASSDATAGGRASPLSFTATLDFLQAYMFRGIRQDDRGLIVWPAAEAGALLFESKSGVKELRANVGLWNSLHSGPTGVGGPSAKMWYESDFYSNVTATLPGGFSIGTTYTAYMSPNDSFRSVRELSLTFALDDAGSRVPMSPYALVAFELEGQADGGSKKGTYLELGGKPGKAVLSDRLTLTFPVKVGLSLNDYYETSAGSGTFGYLEAGALATAPLRFIPQQYGTWAVRGGLSVLTLGDSLRVLNDGEKRKVVATAGIAFSR